MVPTCRDDYSEGSDGSKNPLEVIVIKNLYNYFLQQNTSDSPKQAACIREYVEWLLDDSRDLETKKNAGFLELEYQSTLLKIVERMLPDLNGEHKESYPEFPMLRDKLDQFKDHIIIRIIENGG